MIKKKAFTVIFCTLFFVICTVFSLGMLIPGTSKAADNATTFPKLIESGKINHSFGNDLEEWFSENFAFRNFVVDSFSELKMNIFSEGNSQVIVGKDDFLFFEETLDCYLGNNMMSEDELSGAAETLLQMQNAAKAAGAEFIFVIAPNKNSVYSEMMPDRYVKNPDITDADRLYEKLDSVGVMYIDLREILISAKETSDTVLYHKRDSHWNSKGALIAFNEITKSLGIEDLPVNFEELPTVTDNTFEGDLDALLFPGVTRYDEDLTYDFKGKFVYTSAYANPMDITITTRGGGSGKLLMFRDSFANALIPYAASSFSEVRFERTTPYNAGLITTFGADCVIVEIAERNLRELANYGAK